MQILSYEYNYGEQWRTWPKLVSLQNFEDNMASETIRRLVKVYFDSLQAVLTEMDTDIDSMERQITSTIKDMQAFFSKYSDDLVIDGEFLK